MNKTITKRSVEAVVPGPKDVFLWDTDLKGFGVKVTPTGSRVYLLQYRASGRLRRYTIGKHGSPWAPAEARKQAAKLLGEVASGRDPGALKVVGRLEPTFADTAQRYLAEHASTKKKARSIHEDQRLLAKVIIPQLGKQRTSAISHSDVAKLHHELRATPYQANRVIALLSKILKLAEKWGLRGPGTNPCHHVGPNEKAACVALRNEDQSST